jgi:glycosyltransferase involved in cell wall biosynthesis
LNEAESIAFCVDQAFAGLRVAKVRGEVLVVDNGCRDASAKIALEHGAPQASAPLSKIGTPITQQGDLRIFQFRPGGLRR